MTAWVDPPPVSPIEGPASSDEGMPDAPADELAPPLIVEGGSSNDHDEPAPPLPPPIEGPSSSDDYIEPQDEPAPAAATPPAEAVATEAAPTAPPI